MSSGRWHYVQAEEWLEKAEVLAREHALPASRSYAEIAMVHAQLAEVAVISRTYKDEDLMYDPEFADLVAEAPREELTASGDA